MTRIIEFDIGYHVRSDSLYISLYVSIQLLIVDQNPVIVLREQVPHDGRRHIYVFVDHARRRGFGLHALLDFFPLADKQIQICIECFGASTIRNGAHNHTKSFGQKTAGQSA